MGAQSHVAVSLESPEYTADVDGIGTLRMLKPFVFGVGAENKILQASSSRALWLSAGDPAKETTPFYPRSPYAVAKLYSYWICVNYREAYGMYACNGICLTMKALAGETFVTRKITRRLANIALGLAACIWETLMLCAIGGMRRLCSHAMDDVAAG